MAPRDCGSAEPQALGGRTGIFQCCRNVSGKGVSCSPTQLFERLADQASSWISSQAHGAPGGAPSQGPLPHMSDVITSGRRASITRCRSACGCPNRKHARHMGKSSDVSCMLRHVKLETTCDKDCIYWHTCHQADEDSRKTCVIGMPQRRFRFAHPLNLAQQLWAQGLGCRHVSRFKL